MQTYYYFIFASQHDPLASLSRETGTPHSAGLRFKKWSRSYTPAPPTASHCAASNAHTPNWCASSSERWVARLVLASQAPGRSRPLTASDGHGARAGALYVYRAWERKGGKADARVKGAPMGGWGVSRARRVRCGADLLPSRLLPSRLLPFI